ncbi:alpha/beta hydrolase [Leifsonia sp. AG29]|uniref:alpha/beta hydrolase n=1 Tax=Leifsonia sp. AG29 TaxID=2598860 RepID=UPI00131E3663|nr:alpha/beta hydrolase family protein [Leifsonia sp. AG29]
MTYTFAVDPQNLFEERTRQFANLGLNAADIAAVRSRVTDMWSDQPGGWVYEWSRLAERYSERGDHLAASLAYGCAKFPSLATDSRRTAIADQVREYEAASPDFPVVFERHVLRLDSSGIAIDVPVHVLTPPDATDQTPVLIASGGIDTWKLDLHQMLIALSQASNARIVAFDHPGVGELTDTPLTPTSYKIVDQIVGYARTLTRGRVGHFGLSFGGYFSASSGLRGVVDAAIVLGGPVTLRSFGEQNLAGLLFGMEGILGNALGFDHAPSTAELTRAASGLALDDLLIEQNQSRMLVVNGDADVHVPPSDAHIFEGRDRTTVSLIRGAGHCAIDKMDELMPILTTWTRHALAGAPFTP